MTREVSAAMAAALLAGNQIALLAEIEHPSGTARFWSGIGKLRWNDYEWTGSGTLGTITPIKYSSQLNIQEISFNMNGVSPDDVSGLDDNVRNLSGAAWLACLDERGIVIDDPIQIVDAQLDYQSFTADETNVSITITARTGFYTLERSIDECWSAEDQRLNYPNDSGMDFLSELANQNVIWSPT